MRDLFSRRSSFGRRAIRKQKACPSAWEYPSVGLATNRRVLFIKSRSKSCSSVARASIAEANMSPEKNDCQAWRNIACDVWRLARAREMSSLPPISLYNRLGCGIVCFGKPRRDAYWMCSPGRSAPGRQPPQCAILQGWPHSQHTTVSSAIGARVKTFLGFAGARLKMKANKHECPINRAVEVGRCSAPGSMRSEKCAFSMASQSPCALSTSCHVSAARRKYARHMLGQRFCGRSAVKGAIFSSVNLHEEESAEK